MLGNTERMKIDLLRINTNIKLNNNEDSTEKHYNVVA